MLFVACFGFCCVFVDGLTADVVVLLPLLTSSATYVQRVLLLYGLCSVAIITPFEFRFLDCLDCCCRDVDGVNGNSIVFRTKCFVFGVSGAIEQHGVAVPL